MARKLQNMVQDVSSDAPEVITHSRSKADAKRNQKALHDFEEEEKARKKARNRERDQKLKERARVTRGGKADKGPVKVKFLVRNDAADSIVDEDEDDGDVEARMLRAMRDAADEVESAEGEVDSDGFEGFGEGMELNSDSDSSFAQIEGDEDTEMSPGEDGLMGALTDEDDSEEDDRATPLRVNTHSKANYLADDIFAAAFAFQSSKLASRKNTESTQQRTIKKRRRKSIAHTKDLVMGGRTIRTLPQLSDPRSQATARSIPSARARKFVDHSLAMKGKRALLKAKKKGWERRQANVGVMKYQGAPHGFARSTR